MRVRTASFAALPTGWGCSSVRMRPRNCIARSAENARGGALTGSGRGGRSPAQEMRRMAARRIDAEKTRRIPGTYGPPDGLGGGILVRPILGRRATRVNETEVQGRLADET